MLDFNQGKRRRLRWGAYKDEPEPLESLTYGSFGRKIKEWIEKRADSSNTVAEGLRRPGTRGPL